MKSHYGPYGLIAGGAVGLASLLALPHAPGWIAYTVVFGGGLIGALIGSWAARRA